MQQPKRPMAAAGTMREANQPHGCRLLTTNSSDMATWAVWLMKLTMEATPMAEAPHMRKHEPHQPKFSGRHATHRNLHDGSSLQDMQCQVFIDMRAL